MRHAATRAFERYGLQLTLADLKDLVAEIKAKKTLCTKKLIDSEIHIVNLSGVAAVLVYDPAKEVIITFLPKEAVISNPGQVRHRKREVSFQKPVAQDDKPKRRVSKVLYKQGRKVGRVP